MDKVFKTSRGSFWSEYSCIERIYGHTSIWRWYGEILCYHHQQAADFWIIVGWPKISCNFWRHVFFDQTGLSSANRRRLSEGCWAAQSTQKAAQQSAQKAVCSQKAAQQSTQKAVCSQKAAQKAVCSEGCSNLLRRLSALRRLLSVDWFQSDNWCHLDVMTYHFPRRATPQQAASRLHGHFFSRLPKCMSIYETNTNGK